MPNAVASTPLSSVVVFMPWMTLVPETLQRLLPRNNFLILTFSSNFNNSKGYIISNNKVYVYIGSFIARPGDRAAR